MVQLVKILKKDFKLGKSIEDPVWTSVRMPIFRSFNFSIGKKIFSNVRESISTPFSNLFVNSFLFELEKSLWRDLNEKQF